MASNKVFPLRMPGDLREAIDKRAEKRFRSINNEIVVLLKLGLVSNEDEAKALNDADKLITQSKKESSAT